MRGISLLLASLLAAPLQAADVLPGFVTRLVAGTIAGPTAMAFAPDGRLFICRQEGVVRVIKDGVLLPAPFVTVTTDPLGERGLLGIAIDPQFDANGYVYLYYTATTPATHNRVSRFTASGDTAAAGSELILLELENLGTAAHNGGALHFGPDGKLYVAVGENTIPENSQTLANRLGKMLRVNSDGSIPADNPFFTQASGVNRAIWALGLRNPFTFAFGRESGRMFINDVGQVTWEEINDGVAGANYGWPLSEGPTMTAGHTSPVFVYGHGTGEDTGCAIAGGAFYEPEVVQFPAPYRGRYFFADLCSGWVRSIDPAAATASPFASGVSLPVDIRLARDGSLWILGRGDSGVWRVRFAGAPRDEDANGDGMGDLVWRNSASGESSVWFLSGLSVAAASSLPQVAAASWAPVLTADFQGDGRADVLWRDASSGALVVWLLHGSSVAASGVLPAMAASWTLAGAGDFQGDGKSDLLWRNSGSGENVIWFMSGASLATVASLPSVPDAQWRIAAIADLDSDGNDDIVWRHESSGSNSAWLLDGPSVASSATLPPVFDPQWRIAGAGDFQGDGKADLLWRHQPSGANALWLMNGLEVAATSSLPDVVAAGWRVARVTDVQGDGKADIIWRNSAEGSNAVWLMNGAAVAASNALPPLSPDWHAPELPGP